MESTKLLKLANYIIYSSYGFSADIEKAFYAQEVYPPFLREESKGVWANANEEDELKVKIIESPPRYFLNEKEYPSLHDLVATYKQLELHPEEEAASSDKPNFIFYIKSPSGSISADQDDLADIFSAMEIGDTVEITRVEDDNLVIDFIITKDESSPVLRHISPSHFNIKMPDPSNGTLTSIGMPDTPKEAIERMLTSSKELDELFI